MFPPTSDTGYYYYLGITDDRTGPQRGNSFTQRHIGSESRALHPGCRAQSLFLALAYQVVSLDGSLSLLVPGEGARHQSQVHFILFYF